MFSFAIALIFTSLALHTDPTQAQLLSCADVGCPSSGPYCSCTLGNQVLTSIGVSSITSEVSAEQLSWTVGFVPGPPVAEGNPNIPDTRNFYLGQPPSLNLHDNTDVTACALFFDGVASKLKFDASEAVVGDLRSNGSCEDALTASCITDLKRQAQDAAVQSNNTDLSCQGLAEQLRSSPPAACRVAENTWGVVSAYEISGPQMPFPLTSESCNPTVNSTYSVTKIHTTNLTTQLETYTGITPILTVIKTANGSQTNGIDTNLSCLKPVLNEEAFDSAFQGGSTRFQEHLPFQLLCYAVVTLGLLF